MRRRYERELFADRVAQIKKLKPDCCIGVDVIVGFTKRTKILKFPTSLFVIWTSLIYTFLLILKEPTRAHRSWAKPFLWKKDVSAVSVCTFFRTRKRHFYEQNIGTVHSVLFEEEEDLGFMYGFTENYIKVKTPYNTDLVNQLITVQLDTIDREGIFDVTLLETVTV